MITLSQMLSIISNVEFVSIEDPLGNLGKKGKIFKGPVCMVPRQLFTRFGNTPVINLESDFFEGKKIIVITLFSLESLLDETQGKGEQI